ncbi:unnamed protein product [Haemonchus placei]|uniref:Dolichyl-diphosphooligosaccharide--protein glycosyltransferase subunit 2 n=1 Tax=Haemonchus placei TaxID=6290 RepID=A0A0N4XBT3_HAEPC|nr:unnamed protein product [Haemonchus placei]
MTMLDTLARALNARGFERNLSSVVSTWLAPLLDERHVGLTSSSTTLKSSDEVMVEDFKVGALGKDDVASGAILVSVAQFSKYEKVIEADITKRLYMSFSVRSKVSMRLVQPHQAFILFKHVNGGEVFYTADVQTGGEYLVDINLAKAHKDFEGVSGKYTVYLIIGDATIRTPLNWPFYALAFLI